MIVDPKTERILGVGLVGVNAGEMIAELALGMQLQVTVEEMAKTIGKHGGLGLSRSIHDALLRMQEEKQR